MSVAAWLRERSRRRATSRSSRRSLSASRENWWTVADMPARSAAPSAVLDLLLRRRLGNSRGSRRARRRAILAPERQREQAGAGAYRDVGHVERGPAPVVYADVQKIHHTERRANPINEIADGAAAHHAQGHDAQPVARPRRAEQPPEHGERHQREHQEYLAGIRAK